MRREALYGRCFFSLAFHEKRHSFPFSGCKDVLCSTSVPLSFSSRGQPRCCVLVRQRTIHAVHPSSLQSNDQPRRPRSRFLAGGVLLLQQRVSILNSEVVQPLKKRVCYVLFYSYFTFFCSSPSTSPPLSSGSFFFFPTLFLHSLLFTLLTLLNLRSSFGNALLVGGLDDERSPIQPCLQW